MLKILPFFLSLSAATSVFAEDEARRVIRSFDEITFADRDIFGAAVADLAATRNLLPEQLTLPGFAIPFYFYQQFVEENRLAAAIQEVVAMDPGSEQSQKLQAIQETFLSGNLPFELELKLEALRHQLTDDVAYQCESSTNLESAGDLVGSQDVVVLAPNASKEAITDAVRKIWAGAWTEAALADRFARDHGPDGRIVEVAVVVQPDAGTPVANGLAITKNISAEKPEGFSVFSQIGKHDPRAGTNPAPELVTLIKDATGYNFEIQLDQVSERLPEGQSRVLEQEELRSLYYSLLWVQARFAELYGAEDDVEFAMAVAFILTADDRLILQRVGPWRR